LKTCHYPIQELWDTEKYDTLADLLQTGPCEMTPELLALQAKIWFKLATDDGKHLTTMLLYWITAVYSRQISAGLTFPDCRAFRFLMRKHESGQRIPERKTYRISANETILAVVKNGYVNRQDGRFVCKAEVITVLNE
jgi:hypothetical protein